jgi:hypothetical protein
MFLVSRELQRQVILVFFFALKCGKMVSKSI